MIIVSGSVWCPFIVWGRAIPQKNRLGTHMKESWEGGGSRAPCARSAWKRLRLFSEKSAILVRFRSNSGLEPLWIPNEEFLKEACFARAARPQCAKTFVLFCEKSTILVRFRSNSGLEPLWIPYADERDASEASIPRVSSKNFYRKVSYNWEKSIKIS